MLSIEQFNTLEIGDIIEVGQLFPGLTAEPVVLRVESVRSDSLDFLVTYCGTFIGKWVCTLRKDRLSWITS